MSVGAAAERVAARAHECDLRADRFEALAESTGTGYADLYRKWAGEDREEAERLWKEIEGEA